MWVWVLKDSNGNMPNMFYKHGTYGHLPVFSTREKAVEAADYYGGAWFISRQWLGC